MLVSSSFPTSTITDQKIPLIVKISVLDKIGNEGHFLNIKKWEGKPSEMRWRKCENKKNDFKRERKLIKPIKMAK